jgi:2-polyprenyl-6-hydroxyphenyl methylase/3-demethylubiquinone-9 3-methyltransferase
MVPKGTHDVKKFIKPAELSWVDQTWLKEQHITGLHYNPLHKIKARPVDVNYMLHNTAKND